jgi:tyrosyl-DNA phosphodiesterase 2
MYAYTMNRDRMVSSDWTTDWMRRTALPWPNKRTTNAATRILTWNIDGLNRTHLIERTNAIAAIIRAECVDVALLQEVVSASASALAAACPDYQLLGRPDDDADDSSYYTAIMLRKATTSDVGEPTREQFANTRTRRGLLSVEATLRGGGDIPCTFMTTHLESTPQQEVVRAEQLRICFERMGAVDENRTPIFGGDLNAADGELMHFVSRSLRCRDDGQQVPQRVYRGGSIDVYEMCAKDQRTTRWTWDTTANDNLFPRDTSTARYRFDRIYYRHRSALAPIALRLVGCERIPSVGCFPSDHWGLLCNFAHAPH